MGLEKLGKNFWEIRKIRKGLKLWILLRWRAGYVEFVLPGTRKEIKRYLKR
jgi:hypothetical protein